MQKVSFTLIILLSILGCNQDSFDDSEKRNENWVWFEDSETGNGEWILIGVGDPVQSGKYTKFFPNGNIYEKGTILNEKQVDTSFLYDLNEKLIKYKIYLQDSSYDYIVNDGYYESFFHQTGKTLETGTAHNHVLGGNWIRYYKSGKVEFRDTIIKNKKINFKYFESGKIKSVINYLNNKKENKSKKYYENGQLHMLFNWKNGKLNGPKIFYFKNGQVNEKVMWINGVRNGYDSLWYKNGQLNQTSTYKNDQHNGYIEIWYPNGNFKFKGTMKNGLFDNKCINFHETGIIQAITYMKENEPHGSTKHFDYKGKLLKSFYYENGKMEGEQKFYENGQLDQIDIYKNGELIESK